MLLCFATAACTTADEKPSGPLMSYGECEQAKYCRAEGVLSVREVDHVKMGRLDLTDGKCLNVSLAKGEIRRLQRNGPQQRIIEGRVFPGSRDVNLTSLIVNGREIGVSQCGNFYVFVE